MGIPDILFALLGAWLFALLFKGKDIVALAKKDPQRTPEERKKVKAGLLRSLLIEFCILVQASTTLILLVLPLILQATAKSAWIDEALVKSVDMRRGFYVSMGMISYNFPFAAVRQVATRIALNTIKEFYDHQKPRELEDSHQN